MTIMCPRLSVQGCGSRSFISSSLKKPADRALESERHRNAVMLTLYNVCLVYIRHTQTCMYIYIYPTVCTLALWYIYIYVYHDNDKTSCHSWNIWGDPKTSNPRTSQCNRKSADWLMFPGPENLGIGLFATVPSNPTVRQTQMGVILIIPHIYPLWLIKSLFLGNSWGTPIPVLVVASPMISQEISFDISIKSVIVFPSVL